MPANLEHTTLTVRDIDATIGFKQTTLPEFRIGDEGHKPGDRRRVHIGTDDGHIAHSQSTAEPAHRGTPHAGVPGVNQLAFDIDDVETPPERRGAAGNYDSTAPDRHLYRKRIYSHDRDATTGKLCSTSPTIRPDAMATTYRTHHVAPRLTWLDRFARTGVTPTVARLVTVMLVALTGMNQAVDAQAVRVYRVGVLTGPTGESTGTLDAFRTVLRGLGYVEGSNLILDVRIHDIEYKKVPDLVKDMMAQKPDVMVGWESLAQAMRAQSTTIPIVLAGGIDPVGAGLAQTLQRPGLNVTGAIQLNGELSEKHVGLAREIVPRLARVGLFVDRNASTCKAIEEHARKATRAIGATFVAYSVNNKADVEQAFALMEKDRPDVLLPCPSVVLFSLRPVLFENASRLRIPFTSFVVANVPPGVLFAYAADLKEIYRSAAGYVDKILRGANPAELPIEQPIKFEFVVNLKTARAYGITVPQSVLLRADRVLE